MIQQLTISFNTLKSMVKKVKVNWHSVLLVFLLIAFFVLSFFIFRYAPDYLIQVGINRKYPTKETGTTGDTFGGTLGPIVGWLAALLTFAAFWVQYRANQQQRKQIDDQAKDTAIERFENKFFEMLRLHKENVNEMMIEGYELNKTREEEKGKFRIAATSLNSTVRVTSEEVSKIIQGRKVFVTTQTELKACYEICKETLHQENIPNKEEYLIKLAYLFFYNGVGSDIVISCDDTIPHDTRYVTNCKSHLNDASRFHKNSSGERNTYTHPITNKVITIYVKYKPFSGHSSRLGHYYRHLFQMVKYVVNQKDELIKYINKREYLRILRAQLSDQEQAMLYFNYISGFGENWEKGDNKFFSDYRMIHNLPFHLADFTISPEIKFATQIAEIRKKDEEMFEAFE